MVLGSLMRLVLFLLRLVIAIPFFIILTLLSVVFGLLYIVLLPITCVCPCVSGVLGLLEKIIRMPINLLWWVLD